MKRFKLFTRDLSCLSGLKVPIFLFVIGYTPEVLGVQLKGSIMRMLVCSAREVMLLVRFVCLRDFAEIYEWIVKKYFCQ